MMLGFVVSWKHQDLVENDWSTSIILSFRYIVSWLLSKFDDESPAGITAGGVSSIVLEARYAMST